MIDLTDDSLLQNLPPSPPSSAQLHLLAASVVNSAPNNTEHFTENDTAEIPGTLFIYMKSRSTNKTVF